MGLKIPQNLFDSVLQFCNRSGNVETHAATGALARIRMLVFSRKAMSRGFRSYSFRLHRHGRGMASQGRVIRDPRCVPRFPEYAASFPTDKSIGAL